MERKDQGVLKLHFTAINSSNNSQNQQENRLKNEISTYFRWSIFFKGGWKGGGGYVNSENSDCDVSACAWHADTWSGSIYEQSEQVLALWDHFCSFQEIDDLQYLKFSILDLQVHWKLHVFKKESAAKVLLRIKMYIFDKANVFHVFCKTTELNPIICERVTNNKV